MLFYKIPNADEAMLVSGGHANKNDVPFQVTVGRGRFLLPFFRKAAFLTLAMKEAEVQEECFTKQGISLYVRAIVAFKVPPTEEAIINAGQRFLSDQSQMERLTGEIFAGHLRSIVGSMTVEEIVTERQRLAEEVLDASKIEMARLGLLVDSFQIKSIDDQQQGYIAAMAAPHTAAIQRQAKIAQAQANQAAAEAEQISQRNQAEYAQQTAITQAKYNSNVDQETAKAEQTSRVARANADKEIQLAEAERAAAVNAKNAAAEQAGPLAQAQASRDVAEAETALAAQQAELRKNQLRAEVIEPANAAREQRIAQAEGESKAIRLAAEAAASNDRVALDQKIIEQLPLVASAIADGLKGSNLTVLNGTQGLSEIAANVLAQVGVIYDGARGIRAAAQNGHGNEQVSTETPILSQGERS